MALNLERQLTFYGAYHHNRVNVIIHIICVPLILFTAFLLAASSGPLFQPPSWLSVPYLEPNLGTLAAFTWGGLYVLLEPVAGTLLAVICVGAAATSNWLLVADRTTAIQASTAIHILAWILQFIGHGKFEGRAPALLDNLFQAIFLAPLFVWLELLFGLGYRQELQARVAKSVEIEIAKFRAKKGAKQEKGQ